MNTEPTLQALERLRVLPPRMDTELRELLDAALEGGRLAMADWLTLRDLRLISGHEDFSSQALLLALLSALADGNLCLPLAPAPLERRLLRLGASPDRAAAWTARILSEFRPQAYPGLVAGGPEACGPLVVDSGRLFFQRLHGWGRSLSAGLRKRLAAAPPDAPDPGRLAAILREVLVEDPLRLNGAPALLGEEQRLALLLALLSPMLLVSGGPGTGKTALVLSILRCFLRLGFPPERILLAAPTGRAARNLTDFLRAHCRAGTPDDGLARLEAATLHRLLGYNPARGTFGRGPDALLPADLAIIDEVSMVDAVLMARLLEALPAGARLILLGDKDQLPSVEAGALLADLIPAAGSASFGPGTLDSLRKIDPALRLPEPGPQGGPLQDCLVILRRNYRSEERILNTSRRINAGDPGAIRELPRRAPSPCAWPPLEEWREPGGAPGGCWLVPAERDDPGELHGLVRAWAERHFLAPARPGGPSFRELSLAFGRAPEANRQGLLEALLSALGKARLLTVTRRSAWGTEALNRRMADFLRPRLDPSGSGSAFSGAPILITRNDPSKRLFNGDVGLLLRTETGLAAFFPGCPPGGSLPLGLLPPWEPAWASTVHKAQGSEYEEVLLVAPPRGAERILTKEILYTGITRAKRLAVLYGPQAVLEQAAARRVERESGLDLWGAGE